MGVLENPVRRRPGLAPAETVIKGAKLVNVCTAEVQDDIDVAIAIEHLCLAAAEQGLGTCWVCNFRVQLCQELFKLPEEWYPAAIIPIGYPPHRTSLKRHVRRRPK